MSEQIIASARAWVLVYDDVNKKWIPSGTSSELSKVFICQYQMNNTFRVVGRKLQDHEVVIDCAIPKGLKYNQSTATFHQWRDNKQVYGLNFSTKEDADSFGRAMLYALDRLSNNISRSEGHPPMTPVTEPIYQQPMNNRQCEEDTGYRTMTGDFAINQERRMSQQQQPQQQQILGSPGSPSPRAPAPPVPLRHYLIISAPPTPQPQPMALAPPTSSHQRGVPPPAPPCLQCLWTSSQTPAPHMSRLSSSDGQEQTSSLAAQHQVAKLGGSNRQVEENSGCSTSSSGSSGNYDTRRRGGLAGMSSVMVEMAKTLATRRKAVEQKEQIDAKREGDMGQDKKSWGDKTSKKDGKFGASDGGGNGSGSKTPKPPRKWFGFAIKEQVPKQNSLPHDTTCVTDLDSLKQEILKEMRKEMAKLKQDIIDAVRMEFARR
ncbi:hypothetical protein B7P43_G02882 [Cryptotermes secundus]|uniref:WH1 domain-containing protein n=1 Tax=Cryptotermes secundus TaxID=105785 RepID=A0A2J7QG15_9NEOP|nr:hypothetical protein B7P43_G02882 [Cryptotermes secundus]